jgi:SAM-dependent methyltransferase
MLYEKLGDKTMNEANGWQIPGNWVEIYETIFVPAMMGEWCPRLVALVNARPGEFILDVACGTGALTRCAARTIGQQGQVVGLDISPDMLSVARGIPADGSNTATIEWREGDVGAIPFAENTFDVVFCAFGLMFFPDRAAALNEMRRVLKPKGRMALAVWGAMDQCPGQLAMKTCWERHFGPDGAAGFVRQHVLGDLETVHSLVLDAGFRDVSAQPAMGAVRFPSPEHLVRSYGALAGKEADAQTRSQIIEEVNAALQSYVGEEGLVYPIEAILACGRK